MAEILVVDDDSGMREFLEILLTQEGYGVKCAVDGKEGLTLCKKHKFDLAITDLRMPNVDGIDFLRGIKEISPETMVVIITAYASGETAVMAMKEGAYDYLEKNFDVEDVKVVVHNALQKKMGKKDDARFIKEVEDAVSFGNLIGKSKEMLKVYSTIMKVADTTANVLILGESGTGKELVARAIHENSKRKAMPFVVINCGGIPENLLESELFGYKKGAFTGAHSDNPGLFQVADGGTVFLDEIGELPTILQVKLLRVIQERTFRRVGGAEDIKVDVRIIAATNQDLEKKVSGGGFREDLYYRINVILIRLPPLRKRQEDIPALVNHFIQKYSNEYGKETKQISPYSIELLSKYRFPGNVRELENIIAKNVALGTSNIVLPEELADKKEKGVGWDAILDQEFPEEGMDINKEISTIEKAILTKALEKARGSKSRAAKLLNVSRDSLRYRLEKLDLL